MNGVVVLNSNTELILKSEGGSVLTLNPYSSTYLAGISMRQDTALRVADGKTLVLRENMFLASSGVGINDEATQYPEVNYAHSISTGMTIFPLTSIPLTMPL